MTPTIVLVVALAVAIGFSVGFSGIGGFLVVPLLIVVADATAPQAVFAALAANLGATLGNGLLATVRGHIDWHALRYLVLGSVVGGFIGVWLVGVLSPRAAQYLIALSLTGMGFVTLLPGQPRLAVADHPAPRTATGGLGLVAQVSALLVGIGGPAITVPVLASWKGATERVVGTALLHGAFVSALGLLVTGRGGANVDWLMLAVVGVVVIASLLASSWRKQLLTAISIRPFVGVMALVGAAMLLFRW